MKYICNQCAEVFQADDITIHYKTGNSGLEIVAICQSCLVEYMEKTKANTNRKDEDAERLRMERKW